VGVAVDATGEHDETASVDLERVTSHVERLADRDDTPVLEQQVADIIVDGSDDASVADERTGHGRLPR
jgi:hypothetical protein